ncbi:gametogenetin [Suncus etruscus]|uniref:gametogenetin n=1 Tax=Suncus etruscus TaxID=109475 RepID=UPI0021105683|nr:gametogenetin [Suncus etruscus]
MGNVQSEPSTGGGSRKEQASDRTAAADSRRTSLAEPEGSPPSPAMRLARGLGVWFPGSSAPPGLLVPPEPQVSPLTSPVTPHSEEAAAAAAAAAVSTPPPPPPPVGTLLPASSKWRKPTGTPVGTRIRGLLETSHRGQGDPPSLRARPPTPRPPTREDPQLVARVSAPTPPPPPSLEPLEPVEPWKPPPAPDRRVPPAPASAVEGESPAGPAAVDTLGPLSHQVGEEGEGEMARSAASEPGLSLLCKVTFKPGPPPPPAAEPGASAAAAKALPGGAVSVSYAEALKQGPQGPGAARPQGEAPRGAQDAEGGDGDGEGCSGAPATTPAAQARALPPPPYPAFPGSKPKFEWASPPDGPERHFRFNGAGRGVGAPRRRATALSGPWGSPPPPPPPPPPALKRSLPAPGSRRLAPSVLAPPMFIFPPEPARREPASPDTPRRPDLPPPPPAPTPPPARPLTPRPPELLPAPPPRVSVPPSLSPRIPEPGGLAPPAAPALPLASATDQAPAPTPAPAPPELAAEPAPTSAVEPPAPAPAPTKTRTRRSKASRAARAAAREEGAPRGRTADDSRGGAPQAAGTAKGGSARHWPPFQVLNSCPCKCYCRHQPRHRRLPRNVSAWLSTPTNHLSEPPWVATIKLAGSLVAGLEHYDLQATHSN